MNTHKKRTLKMRRHECSINADGFASDAILMLVVTKGLNDTSKSFVKVIFTVLKNMLLSFVTIMLL